MENFSDQITITYGKLTDKLVNWVDSFFLQLPNLLLAIIIGTIGYFLSGYVRKIAVKATSKLTENRTIHNLMSNLTAAIFGLIVFFIILSVLNLDSTINKILATAGVLGLAVGLALQDPMNNLFSGVFMSVRDLYKIGDLVETNGFFGTIKDIDLRATKIKLPSGEEVVIPNKEVLQHPLKNFNASGERRVEISCGVSYGDNLKFVERITTAAIAEIDSYIQNRPPEFFYTEFADSSINFIVRYWIYKTDQRDFLDEKSRGIKAIKEAFDKEGITIPFPIRTLDFGIKGGQNLGEILPGSKLKPLD